MKTRKRKTVHDSNVELHIGAEIVMDYNGKGAVKTIIVMFSNYFGTENDAVNYHNIFLRYNHPL